MNEQHSREVPCRDTVLVTGHCTKVNPLGQIRELSFNGAVICVKNKLFNTSYVLKKLNARRVGWSGF